LYHFDINSFEGGRRRILKFATKVLKNIGNYLLSGIAKRGRNGLTELQKKYAHM
jgi:hypothetical protein